MTPSNFTETPSNLSVPASGPNVPVLLLTEWQEAFPGVVAGITTGGSGGGFDLALWGGDSTGRVLPRWESLRLASGMVSVVHARQVHQATVRHHRDTPAGLHLAPNADGHLTRTRGTLLTVSVADCVPVFLIAPDAGVIGLLHGGWRSVAAGILEDAVEALRDHHGLSSDDLHLHLGPSICGECYEVGPEVFEALGEPVPDSNTPIDLPGVLIRRAAKTGILPGKTSRSTHCTKCGDVGLFSHRGGHAGRQMAFLGLRE